MLLFGKPAGNKTTCKTQAWMGKMAIKQNLKGIRS
jgi:hypothetical protein